VTGDADCRAWVEQDEGPYHLDDEPFRRDLVEDRTGMPLALTITLRHDDGTPVVGAAVDVWHCDALGRYSGFPPAGSDEVDATPDGRSAERFLRGRQRSDADGRCEFQTVYPGWYGGRTVHIHVIAEVDGRRWTSQLFFPEDLNDELLARPPYSQRPGRDTTNATDEIFAHHGEATMLTVTPDRDGHRAGICLQLGHPDQSGA
jgi:protocatechuate 3,4-dioxygenase beta subunit